MQEKSYTAYKTIGEVSKELSIPTHVLRFWESKFKNVKPLKRKNGHRYYTLENISVLSHIKNLLQVEGLTIKGAQKILYSSKGESNSAKKDSNEYLLEKELIEIKKNLKNIFGDLNIS
tara:strand:- start:56 stop:409 length:354 start_codon:yes stop_codon:yes gene_type:complete